MSVKTQLKVLERKARAAPAGQVQDWLEYLAAAEDAAVKMHQRLGWEPYVLRGGDVLLAQARREVALHHTVEQDMVRSERHMHALLDELAEMDPAELAAEAGAVFAGLVANWKTNRNRTI